MKIALITDDFPPLSIGGIATYSFDLAYALSKRGIETTVFCGRARGYRVDHLNPYLTIVHLPYRQVPPRYLWFQMINLVSFIQRLTKFDVLHATSALGFGLMANFKSVWGRPLVTTIHGNALSDLKVFARSPISEWTIGDLLTHGVAYPLNEALTEGCLKHSDHIFVCGSCTLRDLKTMHRVSRTVSVVRNGIDFRRLPTFNRIDQDPNLLLYYGRLEWNKGLLYLIRALSLLISEFPNLRLEICGTGPLTRKVKQLVSNLSLATNVSMNGFVMHDELLKKISRSRLVALPSLCEAQPISPLEAMALARPVVAFDYAFAREYIVDSQNGLLARPKSCEDLAAKIRVLLTSAEECSRLGKNAHRYIERSRNWETLVNEYLRVYDQLV